MKRNSVVLNLFLLIVILISVCNPLFLRSVKAADATIYLQQSSNVFNSASIGTLFDVTVWITTPPPVGVSAFNVYLEFNDSILRVAGWSDRGTDPQYIFSGKTTSANPALPNPGFVHLAPGKGRVQIGVMLFPTSPTQPPCTVAGKLCTFQFNITSVPTEPNSILNSTLRIDSADTFLLDPDGNELEGTIKQNGYYEVRYAPLKPDVAVTAIELSSNLVPQGSVVHFNATLKNQGSFRETFNVTATVGTSLIAAETFTLSSQNSTLFVFEWDTTGAFGDYEIVVKADQVSGEEDVSNNQLVERLYVYVGEPPTGGSIFVSPTETTLSTNLTNLGEGFNVTIWIMNAPEFAACQVYMEFNDSILQPTRRFEPTDDSNYVFHDRTTSVSPTPPDPCYVHLSPGRGRIQVAVSLFPTYQLPVRGTGKFCVIEFNVTAIPAGEDTLSSLLVIDKSDTYLLDCDGYEISGTMKENGYYEIVKGLGTHDIAVSGITVSRTLAVQGDIVDIQVNVTNNGCVAEYAAVTVYADANTTIIGDEKLVGTRNSVVFASTTVTLPFVWDTSTAFPGNLTISAKAQITSEETNTTNNLLMDGTIQIVPYIHDVAVVDVRSLEHALYVGDLAHVEADIQNQGNLNENLEVTVYADTNLTVIGDEVVVGVKYSLIGRYSSLTMTFDWDTTGLATGNYTLTAVVTPVPDEVDLADNNMTGATVLLFDALLPCPDINLTCPTALTINPSIFTYDARYQARLVNIGNITVDSVGFEGGLRILGSRNGTIRLCVSQPNVDVYNFYLPQNGEVQIPLWLMFQPETHWETYNGDFTLNLTVCGTHRRQLTIKGISINVCQNGAYTVYNHTVTFEWNLTGGSLVYLEAETDLPPGWTYSVDPPIGTFFETPHIVAVNITAPPDAKEGDMGRVTLRAYKNSTGQLIWQFIYFATTDNKPPTIESVEMPIASPDGHLLFNATVKDLSGIANVLLHYSIDGGPWENATMQWASGDTFNSTQYAEEEFFGTSPKTVQYYVSAADWLGNETTSDIQTITIANDVAVTGLEIDNQIVSETNLVAMNVTVTNLGSLPLSFANVGIYVNSTLVTTLSLSYLQVGVPTALNYSLTLPKGTYIITAFAAILPDEVSTADNAKTAGLYYHGDVSADSVVPCKTVVRQGYSTQVNVTVSNKGSFTETFKVTLYANTTSVEDQTVTLSGGNTTILVLDWNTTEFDKGNYVMSVHAWPVEGETLTADNTHNGGNVTVAMVGDVNADGKVDVKDVYKVALAYGTSLEGPNPPDRTYNPNCDINDDNKVDVKDYYTVCKHYGETES